MGREKRASICKVDVSCVPGREALSMVNPGDAGQPLIPLLPEGDFVTEPEERDRFLVRLWPDGTVSFTGSRPRIAEFLQLCAQAGLEIRVDHISRCG